MSKPIIEIKNISKKYRIGAKEPYFSLRDVLSGLIRNPFDYLKPKKDVGEGLLEQEFWALKDISFNVEQGEVIGIIGRNGAGKSTLLKLLSRITPPTVGEIVLRGRMASLLEVGTGFHPELTGRENVYLNGAVLGMKRWEVNKKFKQIIEFAELEKFLDTPVKHYSSGMYMRLAFAVAAHLEPEILIIDEVLAVGDTEFQKKCLGKMEEVSQKDGRTILFVSHNLQAISSLCKKAVWLSLGKIQKIGQVNNVIEDYLNSSQVENSNVIKSTIQRKGDHRAKIDECHLENFKNIPITSLQCNEPFNISTTITFNEKTLNSAFTLSFIIEDERGVRVCGLQSKLTIPPVTIDKKEKVIMCNIPNGLPLISGFYFITFSLNIDKLQADKVERALSFTVHSNNKSPIEPDKNYGSILVNQNWTIKK